MKTTKLFVIFLFSLFVCSCTNDSEDDLTDIDQEQSDDDIETTDVTYNNTVKAIIDGSCISCHDSPPRNGAPFALVNFQQVSQRANAIFNAMSRQNGAAGAMPPAGRLPQNTIDQVQEWIDNGSPEN
ncbi:hypothetical protein [Croceitalea rosinachiae]|uniref:Cytochrome c domain-containing protein n=1 Tax=Croceitalea rosinachiae TaxID=3075596 RepID=A0ABU3AC62_9FLAO|nr:hypothetical protein [Croceitalea sp. F388]MDT0607776.1 hypothetical protein [Croceitalea sp. F388]